MLDKIKALWAKLLGPSVGDTEQDRLPTPEEAERYNKLAEPPHPTPGLGPPPLRKQADEE